MVLIEQVPHILSNKKLRVKVFQRWMAEFLGLNSVQHSSVLEFCDPISTRLHSVKDQNSKPVYDIHFKVLNAESYVPQSRKRLFIVALSKKYQKKPFKWPAPRPRKLSFLSILEKVKGGSRSVDCLLDTFSFER